MDHKVEKLLEEGLSLLEEFSRPVPRGGEEIADAALTAAKGDPNAHYMAAACVAFWYFRAIHREVEAGGRSTLLGDYFFSRFSELLVPLDSVWLNDRFSQLLTEDSQKTVAGQPLGLERYLDFTKFVSKGYREQ